MVSSPDLNPPTTGDCAGAPTRFAATSATAHDAVRIVLAGGDGDGKSTLAAALLRSADQPGPVPTTPASTAEIVRHIFTLSGRTFAVADPAGGGAYLRHLVEAGARADVAVLLVDAQPGLLARTRRDALLMAHLNVRHLVLAINKMDLCGFPPAALRDIEATCRAFARPLGFASLAVIPLNARTGDNFAQPSANLPWYDGPPLLGHLESIEAPPRARGRLVFSVRGLEHHDADRPELIGLVVDGQVCPGDEIRVAASGQTARVASITNATGEALTAEAGEIARLRLDRDIAATRGDVVSLCRLPIEITDHFEATLLWLEDDAGLAGRSYEIELAGQGASASLTAIKYRIDYDTMAHEACKTLKAGDIAVCNIATGKALAFDTYQHSPVLGGFTLIDKFSRATVAAGMIHHSLRRAQNVHRQALSVTRAERERMNGHAGKVVWFTGLSGSGKSTLANALEVELHRQGRRTYILDGDNIRQGLNKDLGFTDADRVENIRRIAEVAKLMMDAGLIVMTAFISPFKRERDMARQVIGPEHFVEIFVDTPLAVCEQRDPKGLYKKARAGQLPNMTGINSPYEAPENPEMVVNTDIDSIGQAVERILARLA